MVAVGRMVGSAIPRRLHCYCIPLASDTEQQKISPIMNVLSQTVLIWVISTLAMFDELAQDEEDAEDYDMEALERRTHAMENHMNDDDDAATLVGHRPGSIMAEDAVVFEIGDEDAHELSDDEDNAKKRRGNNAHDDGEEHEREGLIKDI